MADFEIKGLSFAYPGREDSPALKDINLKIERGQYTVLCGKSGCGKTTLLRHMKTVITPEGARRGEVLFCGKPLEEAGLREQSSRIGYVMQDPDNQIVTDKVWHELAFGLESLGSDQRTIRLRVAEMASYFGIQQWFDKKVTELSGGQKQLLNLASVMAMQPDVLILDEPTSQLDPIAASDFLNTVKKINLELRTTIIISEHRLEEIFPSADSIVVMDRGSMIAWDRPENIGAVLKGKDHEMFRALPTPVRVYHEVPGKLSCPLTVREGALWLDETFRDRSIEIRRVSHSRERTEEELLDPEPDDCAVTVKEVWFRYEKEGRDILKGLNLRVPGKSIFTVVGGNGTGKTTALKAICGICRPYRGKITIEGRPLEKYSVKELFNGVVALLPQDPKGLFVKKTVQEELEEMVKGLELNEQEKRRAVEETAALCEIEDMMEAHPLDLSGGEQQRTALAKVLLTGPRVLLLDEPTKGMDSSFKHRFGKTLQKLRDSGITVMIVSHDVEFCAVYGDTVSMFFDGAVMTTNRPGEFFSQNSFYTTAANRMSRHIFENAVTDEDVIRLCRENL